MDIADAIASLLERNEPVPRPLRLPTESDVCAVENELGVVLHPDFRRFQLEASNVCFGIREPFVALPDVMSYLRLAANAKAAWAAGVPRSCIAFCEDNGNYFFLDPAGYVGYYDHDSSSHSVSKQTLADWIFEDWINDPALSDD